MRGQNTEQGRRGRKKIYMKFADIIGGRGQTRYLHIENDKTKKKEKMRAGECPLIEKRMEERKGRNENKANKKRLKEKRK